MGHWSSISSMSTVHSLPRPTGEPRLSQMKEQQDWAVKETVGVGHHMVTGVHTY